MVTNDPVLNMAPENRRKIFQNFSKARSSGLTSKGTIESKGQIQIKNELINK